MSDTTLKSFSPVKPASRGREIAATIRLNWFSIALLTGVLVLWLISLPMINPANMNDLGLVSVLPPSFIIAMGLLTVSFMVSLARKNTPAYILLAHIVLMIFIIHATPQLVYGTVRYSWSWKHVGIVDYIQRNGSVDPTITNLNAYHNWPGFFALAAMYNTVAGITSSLAYAGWGPLFFNLIDMAALLLIFRSMTSDRRLVWLSLWLYFLFSWVGQDYFSPQAFAYFLFLVSMAVVLRWFRRVSLPVTISTGSRSRVSIIGRLYNWFVNHPSVEDQPVIRASIAQRIFLMVAMILIFFVIASSHQLTPLMLISALAFLVIFQVTNHRFLPILMATITTIWVIYMAVGFLNGNLHWIIQSIGSLLDNLNSNVNLAVASPGQQFIARVDKLLSLSAYVFGFLGLIRRHRAGYWDLQAILLTIAPIPMLAMNSYGGEMIFRVYMFSLPFLVFFVASLFYPSHKAGGFFVTPVFTTALSLLLIPGFLLSYYGKERMYYFSPNEVAAAQYLFNNAPKGSLIMDGIWDWPRQFKNYEYYNYLSLLLLTPPERLRIIQYPAQALAQYMDIAAPGSVYVTPVTNGGTGESEPNPPGIQPSQADYPAAYLVITRSQIAESEMTGTLPANWSAIIINALSHSPNFRTVFSNSDAVIFQYVDTTEP